MAHSDYQPEKPHTPFPDEDDDDEDEHLEDQNSDEEEEETESSRIQSNRSKTETVFRRIQTERIPLRVHDVIIKGNDKTKDSVIKAHVEVLKSVASVQELLQAASVANVRLRRLQIFDSVNITLDSGPPEFPRTANVIVEVVESKKRITGEIGMFSKPTIVIWFIIPAVQSRTAAHAKHSISLAIFVQYIPRFFVIFPLNKKIIKATGVVSKSAWAGAAYNLLLYMLASHVLGSLWYLFSISRQYSCWRLECIKEQNSTHSPSCSPEFLDCGNSENPERRAWLKVTKLLTNCDASYSPTGFEYGIYANSFTDDVASANFMEKYFYCLWWGLKSLTCYGQNLVTSTYPGETLFSCAICLSGLVLFSRLIGDMQTSLQSSTARLEEWRIKSRDTEEWMRHRQLPSELQDRVRRFVQYKWLATGGVNEGDILRSLPLDLRRQIQGHLCLALVRRVPFFAEMDDQLLDAICERLVSSLSTKDTYIVREGDPVNEMLFIIRGQLESSTTNGGRYGFFNSITLKPGDFCGEELLTWALMPNSNINRPSSTRTVKSLTEVEAFALRAEDLKFVANQFKRLHSKKLQHAFRYYSHQWRTWGSCFIQAAWRRYKRKKLAEELAGHESLYFTQLSYQESNSGDVFSYEDFENISADGSGMGNNNAQHLGATILASKFAANTRRGVAQKVNVVESAAAASSLKMPKLFKPDEPDFSADH